MRAQALTAGLVVPSMPQPPARFNQVPQEVPVMFDYSLPTWFDTIYEPHLVNGPPDGMSSS